MDLIIPDMSLVVLVGASGSGKSTFARRHFRATQVLSSDFFRGLVSDDENDQSASAAAFDALHYVAGKRLQAGLVTVVDATNVQRAPRAALIKLAREHDVLPVAVVLDVPESVCVRRNAARPDRDFGAHVVHRHVADLRRSTSGLRKEGFRHVHVLRGESEVDEARIVVQPLRNDRRSETGPFDVIGDVHGCRAELEELLRELGYTLARDAEGRAVGAAHPAGRRAVFVGDLVDRGPDTPGVLRLAMGMVEAGTALAVCGNHEQKLVRALRGKQVTVRHGLAESLAQLGEEEPEFVERATSFCDDLLSHYVLDGGNLVVAHAGLPAQYHGRASGRVRSFALYGDTTGETDEYGLPVRYPWANDYRGHATVLYGHTPVPDAEWVNSTMCLDTGCVFGGKLTALRYPERELVSVAAHQVWYEPVRPLVPVVEEREPDALALTDVVGQRAIETATGRVSVKAEQAAAALEVMSRFALDPRWLVYLPPTMAPAETHKAGAVLEHPLEAFAAYPGMPVLCEEKHMGSRAVVLVTRSAEVAPRRFGIEGDGAVYTRTGRPFFTDDLTTQLLHRVRAAVDWDSLATDWVLLDTELLPWNAKASGLITDQFAALAAAGGSALPASVAALTAAAARGVEVEELLSRTEKRLDNVTGFRDAYRRYCAPTSGLDGVRLAPFQVLATEGATHHTTPHDWHLAVADRLAVADPDLFTPTRNLAVDTGDPGSVATGVAWWEELTAAGGEGMVVKPAANFLLGKGKPVLPGVKVRGGEYLRLIYGPDYPDHLDRLRDRKLAHKRSLAQREYALGLEALTRLTQSEPLWRVHECVFAVLALESDPVDPRL
ncbi:polynucleotide kinase-phosphatase [Actinokineospora sp. NBRC 105648]|uniref:polynucleotide kinase-phosphatase n=1 Tax=Actinokineospora sp. NBRC 105648 TaxID=3032206 RepID=UPI0024A4D9B5|nr:polynucleotide kinase-phosphatase [Actinokineospora sp. NBRC 105648]GLZ43430.1 polynucleotide kinase-phosphatase [Actinokineospora sp. NBRC 105648]